LSIGISSRIAANISAYTAKNGKFKEKADVKKIYGMTDSIYLMLEPFIQIEKVATAIKEKEVQKPSIQLKDFDPNKQSKTDWLSMGVSEQIANNAVNYIKAGGSFSKAKDLQKLYAMDSVTLDLLLPYVMISEEQVESFSETKIDNVAAGDSEISKEELPTVANVIVPSIAIDINQIESVQIEKAFNFSTVQAERIVNYRQGLGGFHSVDQFGEVDGLTPEVFNLLRPALRVNKIPLTQIDVNLADAERFAMHPYISEYLARHIVNFRNSKERFKKLKDLKKAYLIDDALYEKLLPYLSIEDPKSVKNRKLIR